jgi:hypothetical protein
MDIAVDKVLDAFGAQADHYINNKQVFTKPTILQITLGNNTIDNNVHTMTILQLFDLDSTLVKQLMLHATKYRELVNTLQNDVSGLVVNKLESLGYTCTAGSRPCPKYVCGEGVFNIDIVVKL